MNNDKTSNVNPKSENPKSALKRLGPVATGLSFVGGFIADVLQPLGPFAAYICIPSLITMIVALLFLKVLKNRRSSILPIFIFSSIFFVVSGSIALLQNSNQDSQENGVFAGNIDFISDIQKNMGLIQEDIAEIKITTSRIDTKTDRILSSVEGISSDFAKLAKNGGIIFNPKTPEEHYHNARLHELGGDYGNARRSYLEYFKVETRKLDPHIRFQQFLKIQEGIFGARESYSLIASRSDSVVSEFAKALLYDRAQRIQMIKEFLQEYPDFAPAFYYLSKDFSLNLLGNQSLSDKRAEKEYLEDFIDLDRSGQLVIWIIDQSMVAEWRQDATSRLKKITNTLADSVIENPITGKWLGGNSGWTLEVQIADLNYREIFWREKGIGQFISNGFLEYVNPVNGRLIANTGINLQKKIPAGTEYEVEYLDSNGIRQGPYILEFNPAIANMRQSKQILNQTKYSWLEHRSFNNKSLLYFSHILSHRGVLEKIMYGLDSKVPNLEFEFPEYNGTWPAPFGSDIVNLIEVAQDLEYFSAQLFFKDGTSSEIVIIDK